ncbi:MAG: hypothetical protein ACREGL_08360, partial [Alphaproteobacteria bacterium]
MSQDLAVKHTQRCASDKRPSVVVVIERDGTVVAGWRAGSCRSRLSGSDDSRVARAYEPGGR